MKMKMEVIAVETTGDQIRIQMQALKEHAAEFFPCSTVTVRIPDRAAQRRKYHLGAVITVVLS